MSNNNKNKIILEEATKQVLTLSNIPFKNSIVSKTIDDLIATKSSRIVKAFFNKQKSNVCLECLIVPDSIPVIVAKYSKSCILERKQSIRVLGLLLQFIESLMPYKIKSSSVCKLVMKSDVPQLNLLIAAAALGLFVEPLKNKNEFYLNETWPVPLITNPNVKFLDPLVFQFRTLFNKEDNNFYRSEFNLAKGTFEFRKKESYRHKEIACLKQYSKLKFQEFSYESLKQLNKLDANTKIYLEHKEPNSDVVLSFFGHVGDLQKKLSLLDKQSTGYTKLIDTARIHSLVFNKITFIDELLPGINETLHENRYNIILYRDDLARLPNLSLIFMNTFFTKALESVRGKQLPRMMDDPHQISRQHVGIPITFIDFLLVTIQQLAEAALCN